MTTLRWTAYITTDGAPAEGLDPLPTIRVRRQDTAALVESLEFVPPSAERQTLPLENRLADPSGGILQSCRDI